MQREQSAHLRHASSSSCKQFILHLVKRTRRRCHHCCYRHALDRHAPTTRTSELKNGLHMKKKTTTELLSSRCCHRRSDMKNGLLGMMTTTQCLLSSYFHWYKATCFLTTTALPRTALPRIILKIILKKKVENFCLKKRDTHTRASISLKLF